LEKLQAKNERNTVNSSRTWFKVCALLKAEKCHTLNFKQNYDVERKKNDTGMTLVEGISHE
jgi:hypothetical protein